MSKYALVVFDLDGTLVDSDLALIKVGLKMTETFLAKKDLSIDDFLFLNGPSLDESLPLIFPGVPVNKLREKYYELAPDSIKDMTLFKNVVTVLDELKAQKVQMGIFTSRSRMSVELILKQHGLTHYFKEVVCGDDGFSKKPSGEGLAYISDKLKVAREDTLFVGDNWRDILAGNDVGVPVAFIKPYRRQSKLDINALYMINEISEVLEVISDE